MTKTPKVCLYLEFYHFWGGILFKKIGTGLLSSYKNQKRILDTVHVPYVEAWDDSCDILQINTPWLKSLYLIRKARRQHKPVIIWSHVSAEDIKGVFRFSGFLSKIARVYLRYVYNLADMVFCPSEYGKKLLSSYGIPAEKITVMSNGVDTHMYQFSEEKRRTVREQWKLSGSVVGCVGLAIPRKGIATFLGTASAFPENRFMWFGKIYNPVIAQSLPKSMPANATFTGFVDDIVGAFSAVDIFMFPSYEELEGMVILEAASIGLPILVRDIPTYHGWLTHRENCLIATTDEEFTSLLRELMGDENLRTRLSEQAKTLAESRSLETMGARTLTMYDRVLSSI